MKKVKYLILSLIILIGVYTTFSLTNKNKQNQIFQINLSQPQVSISNTQNIPIPLDIKEKMIAEQRAKKEEENRIKELKKQEELKEQERIRKQREQEKIKMEEKREVAKVVTTTSRGDIESRSNGYVKFTATAYCGCARCCGKSTGRTASGTIAKAGRTVAMPSSYSFGTKIEIQGMGTYVVEDRGGAIKGNRIDIFFSDHKKALDFGRRTVYLKVL